MFQEFTYVPWSSYVGLTKKKVGNKTNYEHGLMTIPSNPPYDNMGQYGYVFEVLTMALVLKLSQELLYAQFCCCP
jgi:hypothetical protein